MSIAHTVLRRMFGQPQGLIGRMGGVIMARMNDACGARAIELLRIRPTDAVLEVGFGPGTAINRLSVAAGRVVGVDPSREMLAQALVRNAMGVRNGHVDLRLRSVDRLPFGDGTFDKAMAINSMQIWPDAVVGLREIWRVLKSGGDVALGFTPYSGQPKEGLPEKLCAAGFMTPRVVAKAGNFCILATKP